jgi:nitrate/nitrite transporter NarK
MSTRSQRPLPVRPGLLALLVGTWFLSVVTQGYIIVPAGVLAEVAATFSVPETTAIWVVSICPGTWALTNFMAGSFIDRYGDVRLAVVATVVTVLACLWNWQAALAGSFWAFLAGRALAGVALGVIWTASANLVGRAVPPRLLGTTLGLFTTSAPTGFAVAQFLCPGVARSTGWPALFVFVAVLCLVGLAVFLLGVAVVDLDAREAAPIDRADVAGVVRNRGVLFGCAMAFAAYSLYLFLNSWMPTYLSQAFTVSLATSSLLAAVFPAVGILSRAGGGIVSDRLFGGDRIPVLKVSFLLTAPAVAAIALTSRLGVLLLVLLGSGFVIQLTFGVVYSYVREMVDEHTAGTALSFLGTAGMAGAFSAPIVAASLLSWAGSYAAAFGYAVSLGVVGILLAWRAPVT